jgi:2-polyprenyl-6-methoxyphenol hydroxylase-like FAD-dependent oxidoreductase
MKDDSPESRRVIVSIRNLFSRITKQDPPRRTHTIVTGGSMAGLLAARVLSDHFDRVTILERDDFPLTPGPRKGVPQARHAHVLLGRGQQIIEQLFPGFSQELTDCDAVVMDAAADVAWLTPAGWARRSPSDLNMLSCSRHLLEWAIRRRVAALPRVRIVEGVDVQRLIPAADGPRLKGVWIRHRGQAKDGHPIEGELQADLVVDAGGRGSRAPRWLFELGYDAPEETVVDSSLAYASCVFETPQNHNGQWRALYIQAQPPEGTRGGLLVPIEGNRWLVTLSGRGGDAPPTDEEGFFAFARSLRSPVLYDSIKGAERVSPISGFRGTENRLRHFERMSRWPGGFVVLGDACCAFNPVYGQGMTTAALGAVTLGESLHAFRGTLDNPVSSMRLAREFQCRLAKAISTPWEMSTGEDYRYPTTVGGNPNWLTRWKHRYANRIIRVSTKDPRVHHAFLRVMHMLRSPASLFHPRVLWSMLRHALRGGNPAPADPSSGRANVSLASAE